MALAAGRRARLAAGLAVAALIAAPGAAAKPPAIRAPEAIVIDAASGAVLYAKRPDGRRAIASTTKLMTALLALQSTRPTEILAAVPYRATPAESRLGLAAGERMTVHDLMRALLLASANDAAATIAHGVAGSKGEFVARMNEEARRLHLTGTSYANPIGLDDRRNYSTPRDLAALARRLMRDRSFARIVDLPRATLRSGAHPRTILNRNELVGTVPFVDGVKTGHTAHAGYVLVGAGRRAGAQVISVVLGEPSDAARNSETVALLRYGLSRFTTVEALPEARTLALAPVKYFDGLKVRLHVARDVRVTVPRGARIETHTRLPFPLRQTGPIPAGTRVGSVSILVDGRRVARAPLVTASPVPGAGFWRRAAIRAGATRPTLALGVVGVALLAAFQLRGLVLRRMRGRVEPE